VVMAALLWRAGELSRAARDPGRSINFGAEAPALPRRVAALASVRRLRTGSVLVCAAVGVVLPWLPFFGLDTSAKSFLMTVVITYALVGAGAFAASRLAGGTHLPFWLLTIVVGAVGAGVSVLVGLPAVRIQGLFL